jgi:hypothetical protein
MPTASPAASLFRIVVMLLARPVVTFDAPFHRPVAISDVV